MIKTTATVIKKWVGDLEVKETRDIRVNDSVDITIECDGVTIDIIHNNVRDEFYYGSDILMYNDKAAEVNLYFGKIMITNPIVVKFIQESLDAYYSPDPVIA